MGFVMAGPAIIYDYAPFNLPPEILRAIGLVVASASHSEHILNMAVGGALGLEQHYAIALTVHMPISLKVSALKSAAEFRLESDDLDQLDLLLVDLDKAFGIRNKYAHHTFAVHPETGAVYRQAESARIRLEIELVLLTVNQIESDAAFVYKAGIALMEFLILKRLLPAFVPTPINRDHKSPAARKQRRRQKKV
jgi:hypothetical protein